MKRLLPILACAAGCFSLDVEGPEDAPRPADAVDVTMQFCSQPPAVFAYKNEGYGWVHPRTVFGQQEFRFPATPRVTIVTGYGVATFSAVFTSVTVLNLTAAEANAFRCRLTPLGPSRMTGLVQTEVSQDRTIIQLGDAFDFTLGNQSFEMTRLGPGTLDLVAINRYFSSDTSAKPRVIVRSVTVADNGPIPMLDFTSTEARTIGSVRVRHNGGPLTVGYVQFETARKSRVPLDGASPFTAGDTVTVPVIPAAFIKAGDLHRFDIQSADRGVTYWQAVPSDTAIVFGPPLGDVTLDTIMSSPMLQLRVRFPSQSAYGAMAEAAFDQTTTGLSRSIEVITTAGFLNGTPAQWEIGIPDLRGVVPEAWILQAGIPTSRMITVRDARPALYHGVEVPAAGETMRFARKFAN